MKKINPYKDKYIIVEIIPTSLDPKKGDIVQLSAIKLDKLNLLDRFDMRLNEDKILFQQFIDMINYDKESFEYVDTTKEILDKFNEWSEGLPLLIIDYLYTDKYLNNLDNKIECILTNYDMEYSSDVIDKIIDKYNLQPSNYIVDILYEGLIYESNNK